jgi:hypothetical protein
MTRGLGGAHVAHEGGRAGPSGARSAPPEALTAILLRTGRNWGFVGPGREAASAGNGTVVRQWAQLDNTCQQWDIRS